MTLAASLLALAAYLVTLGLPGGQAIESEVAGLILITVLVQGVSTRAVALRLGLLVGDRVSQASP